MANKKTSPTDDYRDFLPERLKNSKKLNQSEKNVLATLCFARMNYSIYAEEHDNWFYISQKRIEEANDSQLEIRQINRILLKLECKKIIEKKSGTNHRCTHYRLHPLIVEMLPITEHSDKNANVTLDSMSKSANVTLDSMSINNNVTLDKIRLDKSIKDLDSLINNSTENDDNGDSFEEEVTISSSTDKIDEKEFYKHWSERLNKSKTVNELKATLKEMVFTLPSKEAIGKIYLDSLNDLYNRLLPQLKGKEQKQLIKAINKN